MFIKEKKNLTSIQSNKKHKGVFIVRGSLHVSMPHLSVHVMIQLHVH